MLAKLARGALISATVAATLGWLGTGDSASALTYITPNLSGANGEPTLYQIMDQYYGAGNWTQAPQESVRNPGLGNYNISFDVRYAANGGTFGYIADGATSPTALMTLTGSGTSAVATPTQTTLTAAQTGSSFLWSYINTATGQAFTSSPSDNADGLDHMIGFWIRNPSLPTGDVEAVLAWKDTLNLGDRDFNDAVIQMLFTPAASDPVPEPRGLLVLGAALLALGTLQLRRNR